MKGDTKHKKAHQNYDEKNHQPSAITMRYIRELMNIWLARWAYFNEPMSASLTRAINYLNLYGYQSYKVISRFDYKTAEGKKMKTQPHY